MTWQTLPPVRRTHFQSMSFSRCASSIGFHELSFKNWFSDIEFQILSFKRFVLAVAIQAFSFKNWVSAVEFHHQLAELIDGLLHSPSYHRAEHSRYLNIDGGHNLGCRFADRFKIDT